MSDDHNKNEDGWLAAEFALGVLAGERLELAKQQFETTAPFRETAMDWHKQFEPILDELDSAIPSPQLWQQIENRLFGDSEHSAPPKQPTMQWFPLALAASVALIAGLIPYWIASDSSDEASRRIAQLEATLADERIALSERNRELSSVRADLATRRQSILELEASVADHRMQLSQRETGLEERETQLAEARQALEQQRFGQQAAATAVNELNKAMSQLTHELTAVRAGYEQSQLKLQELQYELDSQRTRYAAASQRAAELETVLAQRESATQLLSSPGLAFSSLNPINQNVAAAGYVMWNKRTGTWLFYTFNLPDLKPSQTYQMWFITRHEGPLSAGLLQPDELGRGELMSASPPPSAGDITAVAMSLEPAGGVNKPTGPIYIQGSL